MPMVIISLFAIGGYLSKFNQTTNEGMSLRKLKSMGWPELILIVSASMFLLSIVGHVRRSQTEASGSDFMP